MPYFLLMIYKTKYFISFTHNIVNMEFERQMAIQLYRTCA